jgi:hypothetical protein
LPAHEFNYHKTESYSRDRERGGRDARKKGEGIMQGKKKGEEKGKKRRREGKGKRRELEQTLTLFFTRIRTFLYFTLIYPQTTIPDSLTIILF